MRRRWEIHEGWGEGLFSFWLFGGIFVIVIVQIIWGACTRTGCGMNSRDDSALLWSAAIWYGSVLAVALLIGLVMLTKAAWETRPRRVWEPITEDLRKVHKD